MRLKKFRHSIGAIRHKSKKPCKIIQKNGGQAAVEYMLLLALTFVVFGIVFYFIRVQLFQVWICEISPRIQSPLPCTDREDCWNKVDSIATSGSTQAQRQLCREIR